MADEVIVIDVDTSGAVEGLDALKKQTDKLKEDAQKPTGIQNIRKELRDLQRELSTMDAGSDQFIELSRRAGQLKDQINDASEAVRANAGPAFESLGNNVNLLKDRFMNLDFDGVAQSFKGVAANLRSFNVTDLTNGIKSMGSAFMSVGKALLANPIFLIAGAIAAAVVYAEDLLALVDGVSSAEEEALKASQDRAKAQEEALNAIGEQENILKLQGKSEREILQLKIAQSGQAIQAAEIAIEQQKQLKQQQIDAAQRNKSILSGLLQFLTAPLQILLAGFDELTLKAKEWGVISEETYNNIGNLRNKFNDSVTSLVFDPEEVASEADAAIAESEKALDKLKNQRAGYLLEVQRMDKAAADEAKKAREERLKEEQEMYKKMLEVQKENRAKSAEISKQIEEDAKNRNNAVLEMQRELQARFDADEKARNEMKAELRKTDEQKELDALAEKYSKMRALAHGDAEASRLVTEQWLKEEQEIKDRYAAEERQKRQAVEAAKVQIASDAIGVLISLNDTFAGKDEASRKKAFERNKKLQIAQALIQTYQAANAAFATAAANPITFGFPAYPFIQAGLAVAAGLANVAKISKTSYESPSASGGSAGAPAGGGSGGGGGGLFTPTPSFQAPRSEQGGQDAMRAYVLNSDITRQGEAARRTQRQSEIG